MALAWLKGLGVIALNFHRINFIGILTFTWTAWQFNYAMQSILVNTLVYITTLFVLAIMDTQCKDGFSASVRVGDNGVVFHFVVDSDLRGPWEILTTFPRVRKSRSTPNGELSITM